LSGKIERDVDIYRFMPIKEYVSFNKHPDIEKGLIQKHGVTDTYGPGTYGIEIEFVPLGGEGSLEQKIMDGVDTDYLVSAIGNNRAFKDAYIDWLMEKRNKQASYRGWDDQYGPPNEDEWKEVNVEPDEENEEEHSEWEENASMAGREYSRWERRDFYDFESEYVKDLGDEVFSYVTAEEIANHIRRIWPRLYASLGLSNHSTGQEDIENVEGFLTGNEMRQQVGPTPTETTWNVGMDGENVEIRSKHLKRNEHVLVEKMFDWRSTDTTLQEREKQVLMFT
jgi:hypothetical protein